MGQYFKFINHDKKEVVISWNIGTGAKLWEWCVNNSAGIFPFLLRKSNEGGGGDICKNYKTAGRWAGDRVALVGDYDESREYQQAEDYKNISRQVADDYNHFVGVKDFQVKFEEIDE